MISTPPPAPPTLQDPDTLITVPRSDDGSPVLLMGLSAHGTDAQLSDFAKAVVLAGFSPRRIDDTETPEILVLFAPNSDRARAVALFRDVSTGKYGRMDIEVFVTTTAQAVDGIDLDSEVSVLPGSAINP